MFLCQQLARSSDGSGEPRPAAPSKRRASAMSSLYRRFLTEEAGQDLIEYALLATFIGLVGIIAYQTIGSTMNTVYRGWDSSVQDQWQTPAPVSAS
jgi:Flp pilus assembly pilin Flp